METSIIPQGKLRFADKHVLRPGMVVQLASFISRNPPDPDHIELRIKILPESELNNRNSQMLFYIQHFPTPFLTDVQGVVSAPAPELLLPQGRETLSLIDYRNAVLHSILHSSLQSVRFGLDLAKNSCELWFGCLRERPSALIPRENLSTFFYRTAQPT